MCAVSAGLPSHRAHFRDSRKIGSQSIKERTSFLQSPWPPWPFSLFLPASKQYELLSIHSRNRGPVCRTKTIIYFRLRIRYHIITGYSAYNSVDTEVLRGVSIPRAAISFRSSARHIFEISSQLGTGFGCVPRARSVASLLTASSSVSESGVLGLELDGNPVAEGLPLDTGVSPDPSRLQAS